jgi:hypothetical protein
MRNNDGNVGEHQNPQRYPQGEAGRTAIDDKIAIVNLDAHPSLDTLLLVEFVGIATDIDASRDAMSRRRCLAARLRALISDETGLERRVDDRELRGLRGMIFPLETRRDPQG